MNVSNMQEHRDTVAQIAADFGIDMGWVLIDNVGDLQIGADADGNVDTKVEQYGHGLWGVYRHEQQTCATADFRTALVDAFTPLAADGKFTSPASV